MTLSSEALAELAQALGADAVSTAREDLGGYERGARYGDGRAGVLIRPADTAQVQAAVRWALKHGVRLIPQGANTNLVASASPDTSGEQAILSLERMRHEIKIDVANRSVVVSAGVTLQALNDKLADRDLCFPIDLGANPTIGGMIATNTGGTRLLRYGDVRHNLLGLEVVLADEEATVLDLLTALRKNNTGVDLKQLFVGTSGAFGVITRAALQLHPLPKQRATALLVPRDDHAVLALLGALEAHFGDVLSAFEGMSRNALECVFQHRPQVRNPFGQDAVPDYSLLVELSSSAPRSASFDLQENLQAVLGELLEADDSPLITAFLGSAEELWALRHAISDSLREAGKVIGFDISMPRSALPGFRERMLPLIAQRWPYLKVCDFGHRGDGGDHFNIVWPHEASVPYAPEVVEELRRCVYDEVVLKCRGSFSAEHGIGPFNQAFYRRYTPQAVLRQSGLLKKLFDPRNMLGNVDFRLG